MQMGTLPQIKKFSMWSPDGKIYGDLICLMLVRIVYSKYVFCIPAWGMYPPAWGYATRLVRS